MTHDEIKPGLKVRIATGNPKFAQEGCTGVIDRNELGDVIRYGNLSTGAFAVWVTMKSGRVRRMWLHASSLEAVR